MTSLTTCQRQYSCTHAHTSNLYKFESIGFASQATSNHHTLQPTIGTSTEQMGDSALAVPDLHAIHGAILFVLKFVRRNLRLISSTTLLPLSTEAFHAAHNHPHHPPFLSHSQHRIPIRSFHFNMNHVATVTHPQPPLRSCNLVGGGESVGRTDGRTRRESSSPNRL